MSAKFFASLCGRRHSNKNSVRRPSVVVPTTIDNINECDSEEHSRKSLIQESSSAPFISRQDRRGSSVQVIYTSVQKLTQNVTDSVNKAVSYIQSEDELPLYAFEIIERNPKWWQTVAKDETSETAITDVSPNGGSSTSKQSINSSNMQLHSKRKTKYGELKESVALLILDPQNDFHEAYTYPDKVDVKVPVADTDSDRKQGTVADTEQAKPVAVTPITRKCGSLGVPGAVADSNRIAKLITENLDKFDNIIVTMDTHHLTHIAHRIFWTRGTFPDVTIFQTVTGLSCKIPATCPQTSLVHPKEFTVITHDDVLKGTDIYIYIYIICVCLCVMQYVCLNE